MLSILLLPFVLSVSVAVEDAENVYWTYQESRKLFENLQVDIYSSNLLAVSWLKEREVHGFLHNTTKTSCMREYRVFANDVCAPYTVAELNNSSAVIAMQCGGGNLSVFSTNLSTPITYTPSMIRFDFQRGIVYAYTNGGIWLYNVTDAFGRHSIISIATDAALDDFQAIGGKVFLAAEGSHQVLDLYRNELREIENPTMPYRNGTSLTGIILVLIVVLCLCYHAHMRHSSNSF